MSVPRLFENDADCFFNMQMSGKDDSFFFLFFFSPPEVACARNII